MKSIESVAAGWYRWMGLSGLLLSVAVFLLYGFDVLPSGRPVWESAEYWSRPAGEYRAESDTPHGTLWFLNLADGAIASTLALALLASTALPTLIALSIAWFRRGDRLYGSLASTGVLVLALAVAGLP